MGRTPARHSAEQAAEMYGPIQSADPSRGSWDPWSKAMPALEILIGHAVPFQLVLFRLAGLFVVAPILANTGIPVRARILAAVTLTAALYPGLPGGAQIPPDLTLFGLIGAIAGETMLGVAMGAIAMLPLIAMQMGGQVMGHQMGLSLARSFDPTLQIDTDVAGQLMFLLAITMFIAVGGIEGLFIGVMGSLERVPPGSLSAGVLVAGGGQGPRIGALELFVGVLGSGTELALRIAAPVVGSLMLVMLAMGFVMKTMPQINILSVGFPFKVLVGLGAMMLSLWIVHEVAGDEVLRVIEMVIRWSESVGLVRAVALEEVGLGR